jgi:hypothetical protein
MSLTALRWILLPFAAVLALVLAALCAERIGIALRLWTYPFVGFFSAFAVVSTAHAVAPARKFFSAFISYVIGGAFAYAALKDCYDPRTYEPTLMPFWVTLAGGAFALAIAATHTFGRAAPPSNKSLERTREG